MLGVPWTDNDEFEIDLSSFMKGVDERPPTKRIVLSVQVSVYDPIGFVAAYVIKIKIFFQELCELSLHWDEKLEERLTMKWFGIVKEFREAKSVVLPRVSAGLGVYRLLQVDASGEESHAFL